MAGKKGKKRRSGGEGWGFPLGRKEKNGKVAGKVGLSRGEEEKKTAKWRGRLGFPAGKKRKKRLSGGEGWGSPRGRREKNG